VVDRLLCNCEDLSSNWELGGTQEVSHNEGSLKLDSPKSADVGIMLRSLSN
jgi:hypothetical protein